MLEVRPGLLLGSMGDALAVLSGVPSVTKVYTVTHLLSVCNEPPDRSLLGEEEEGGGMEVEEKEEDREGGVGQGKRGRRSQMKSVFVQVADMPTSNLLDHFESCVRFIKEGVEQGTVLVHCEHGVSRSVAVVLAYLMWMERSPLKVVYQELKNKKPEIRPNSGFVEQLKLWERMKCRVDKTDKLYRAYQLQHKAREMKDMGLVEEVHMSPDPFLSTRESTGYFRCRKCRRLLFTDDNVLQHDLGQGQVAFPWHKRSETGSSPVRVMKETPPPASPPSVPSRVGTEPMLEQEEGGVGKGEFEREQIDVGLAGMTLDDSSEVDCTSEEGKGEATINSCSPNPTLDDRERVESSVPLPSTCAASEEKSTLSLTSPPHVTPPALTPTDLARVRAQVATVVALGNQSSVSTACSSYFIEPVEWMGALLLGEVEGKLLCPKCNARLGSFNWSGEQCSCGQWVTPSFQVHRSRVDEVRSLSRRKNVDRGKT